MTYTAPIRRKDTAKGHYYVDASNTRVPGVTTIIDKGLPKPALINWSANTTAEAAIDQWDELAQLGPAKRLEQLKKARFAEKDKAAKRGTEVHALAEKLINGEQVDVPDELAGHVESYVSFLDDFQPQPVKVEYSIASYKHGYAGTGDLIAYFPTLDQHLLVDIKTNRSGIFGDIALQLAAYRYADAIIDGNTDTRDEQPVPLVDGCAAVHVRGDGYDLIPVTATWAEFRAFLYAQQVGQFAETSRDLVGPAIQPPTAGNRRQLATIEGNQ